MAEQGQRLILAFDFGTRRIGVAVGNELLHSARELPPLTARDGIPDWHLVTRLIEEWQPDLFVVGLPLNMDGTESLMSTRAREFGNRLHGRYGKPCEMVDGIAAVLILEGWFAHQEGFPGGRSAY